MWFSAEKSRAWTPWLLNISHPVGLEGIYGELLGEEEEELCAKQLM